MYILANMQFFLFITECLAYFAEIVFSFYTHIQHILFCLMCTEKSNCNLKFFVDNWLCAPFYCPHVEQS